MSLEAALEKNTAALNRVAELLEVSNAARADLIAKSGGTPTPSSSSSSEPTVAEIKAAVKDADLDTLNKMLADEEGGKARTTAIDAIKSAIADKTPESGNAANEGTAASSAQADTQESGEKTSDNGPSATSGASRSNPVPTAEEAAQAFAGWFGETNDEGERAKRRGFAAQVVEKLGSRIGSLDDTGRQKAVFWLRRKQAGLEVDLDAAYDFGGDPSQEVGGSADAGDDLI